MEYGEMDEVGGSDLLLRRMGFLRCGVLRLFWFIM